QAGPGSARALSGPTRRRPPGSTHAIEPPPAPMLRTSTEESPVRWPANGSPSHVSLVNTRSPSRTRLTSKLVPPVSQTITSPLPVSVPATVRAATGASEGPERTDHSGQSINSDIGTTPPAELAHDRVDLMGERVGHLREHLLDQVGQRQLVHRVGGGPQQAHGHRLRSQLAGLHELPARAPLIERAQYSAIGLDALRYLKRQPARHVRVREGPRVVVGAQR